MINKVILVGNLGADPETRTAQSGTTIANLRIATTERQKDRDGNWSDHTEWHRVVCFGRTADNVARYLRKGRQVYIEGRIQTRKWQDREGKDRWTTEIVANDVRFLGSRDGGSAGPSYPDSGSGGYGGGGGGGGSWDPGPAGGSGGSGPADDDIPF